MICKETRPHQDHPTAPELTREALAEAVKIADDWLYENRGIIEEGGDGDLADLVRKLWAGYRRAA